MLDPHVFTVADEALTPILEGRGGENHSILISGESGAGCVLAVVVVRCVWRLTFDDKKKSSKTWNTKQALAYLTEVTSRQAKGIPTSNSEVSFFTRFPSHGKKRMK